MKIKEMPEDLRPREKASVYGINTLSDVELIALFIRFGTRKQSALDLAHEVMKTAKSIPGLMVLTSKDLVSIPGIKDAKSLEILALVEIGKRMSVPIKSTVYRISEPQALNSWLNHEIGFLNQENFLVVYLNTQNIILSHRVIFIGTLNRATVHPREIIKGALEVHAASIILVHNHPSGILTPSTQDWQATKAIIAAGKLMEISVLDHLIVSKNKSLSLRSLREEIFI